MIGTRGWMICVVVLMGSGCASSRGPQTADLTAPAAPRMDWKRTKTTASPAGELRDQDLVIREHRFVSHSAELNLDGEDQLQRIVTALRDSRAKIMIEPSGGTPILMADMPDSADKLDVQRRQYVIQKLLSLGIPDAEERVVLKSPGRNI